MKFLRYEGLQVTHETISMPPMHGFSGKIPGFHHARVELNLSNDPKGFKACVDWMNIARTDYTSTSYKIDLGGYIGLWPNEITLDCVVTFVMDYFDSSKKHWKDWFIIDEEEIENASK